ncbi:MULTISPECIES: hypothetical protein [Chitinophagaceae]
MTTNNLDLNAMGLTPMNEAEMLNAEGGSFLGILAAVAGVLLLPVSAVAGLALGIAGSIYAATNES